jgi:hypothetical protein
MADYGGCPVWDISDRFGAMISPDRSPIALELRRRLIAWGDVFSRVLLKSGYRWPDEEMREAWHADGQVLARGVPNRREEGSWRVAARSDCSCQFCWLQAAHCLAERTIRHIVATRRFRTVEHF